MLLAIDVRNTHTVVGLVSGSGDHAKVVHHWRIRTESEATADELATVGTDFILNEAVGTRGEQSTSGQQARLWSREGALLATTEQLAWYR